VPTPAIATRARRNIFRRHLNCDGDPMPYTAAEVNQAFQYFEAGQGGRLFREHRHDTIHTWQPWLDAGHPDVRVPVPAFPTTRSTPGRPSSASNPGSGFGSREDPIDLSDSGSRDVSVDSRTLVPRPPTGRRPADRPDNQLAIRAAGREDGSVTGVFVGVSRSWTPRSDRMLAFGGLSHYQRPAVYASIDGPGRLNLRVYGTTLLGERVGGSQFTSVGLDAVYLEPALAGMTHQAVKEWVWYNLGNDGPVRPTSRVAWSRNTPGSQTPRGPQTPRGRRSDQGSSSAGNRAIGGRGMGSSGGRYGGQSASSRDAEAERLRDEAMRDFDLWEQY
jgi:hypothetical protein